MNRDYPTETRRSAPTTRSASGLRTIMMIAALVAIIAPGMPAFGQACIQVTNSAIVTNGIVFGAFGALPPCVADLGWGGAVGKKFTSSNGAMGMNDPQVFITGFNAANDGTIDKIYVGVHVQVDQELTDLDKLLLVFDVEGNGGAFGANDFAILATVGGPAPVAGEQCDQTAGGVTFYKGAAMAQVALPAETVIKVRRSWDYDVVVDPENEIWEAEFELDVAALGLTAPASGAGFRFGARMIVAQSTNGTEVWRWPSTFPNDANFSHFEPATVAGLTAGSLSTTSFGNCADVVFEPNGSTGVSAWNNSGTLDAFTRLGPADFSGETPLKQNHFRAVIKFFSPANPADNSAVAVPNNGQVEFWLKPYNNGFVNPFKMATVPVAFTHLNEIQTKDVFWPPSKTEYEAHDQDINSTGHACFECRLNNFTVNLNQASDFVQKNLTYTTTSTIRDTFVLGAEGARLPAGQSKFRFMLRARWRNLPKDFAGRWTFTIPNAEKLGIKDQGNGIFVMEVPPKERMLVPVEITGGPMPAPPVEFVVSPKAGGKHMPTPSGEEAKVIEVTPGKMVTIVATGGVTVDSRKENMQSGADGYTDENQQKMKFLLPPDFYSPWQNVGALIGSFDEFKTAFVIGGTMTFIVPKDASKLWLAVNDRDGDYDNNRGTGFNIFMISTDPMALPTNVHATGATIAGLPAQAQAAANLPELDIEAFNMVDVPEAKGVLLEPAGYIAYAVYKSHADGEVKPGDTIKPGGDTTTKPPTTCSCSPARGNSSLGLGFAPMILLAGGALLYRRSRSKRRGGRDEEGGSRG